METIYTQKHNQLTLSLVRDLNGSMYTWYTMLTNHNSGKKLVLDTDHADRSGWALKESVGESPVGLYTIIYSILNGQDLYVFYDKFGAVLMVHYHFTGSNSFDKKATLIGAYLSSGGFGSLINHFRYIKLNKKIYFVLSAGQSFTDKQKGFYSLDLGTSQLKKMVFNDTSRVVVAVYVKDKDIFDNLDYRFLKKERLEQINQTKKFMEKPYYLYEISPDKEQQEKELKEILSVWSLDKYPTFEIPYEERDRESDNSIYRDLSKSKERKRAEGFIREVLELTGYKPGDKFKIQNYLYAGSSGYIEMYYFFYLDEYNREKIIRYDPYENFWHIGDFEEVDFEPQIDIYKSKK